MKHAWELLRKRSAWYALVSIVLGLGYVVGPAQADPALAPLELRFDNTYVAPGASFTGEVIVSNEFRGATLDPFLMSHGGPFALTLWVRPQTAGLAIKSLEEFLPIPLSSGVISLPALPEWEGIAIDVVATLHGPGGILGVTPLQEVMVLRFPTGAQAGAYASTLAGESPVAYRKFVASAIAPLTEQEARDLRSGAKKIILVDVQTQQTIPVQVNDWSYRSATDPSGRRYSRAVKLRWQDSSAGGYRTLVRRVVDASAARTETLQFLEMPAMRQFHQAGQFVVILEGPRPAERYFIDIHAADGRLIADGPLAKVYQATGVVRPSPSGPSAPLHTTAVVTWEERSGEEYVYIDGVALMASNIAGGETHYMDWATLRIVNPGGVHGVFAHDVEFPVRSNAGTTGPYYRLQTRTDEVDLIPPHPAGQVHYLPRGAQHVVEQITVALSPHSTVIARARTAAQMLPIHITQMDGRTDSSDYFNLPFVGPLTLPDFKLETPHLFSATERRDLARYLFGDTMNGYFWALVGSPDFYGHLEGAPGGNASGGPSTYPSDERLVTVLNADGPGLGSAIEAVRAVAPATFLRQPCEALVDPQGLPITLDTFLTEVNGKWWNLGETCNTHWNERNNGTPNFYNPNYHIRQDPGYQAHETVAMSRGRADYRFAYTNGTIIRFDDYQPHNHQHHFRAGRPIAASVNLTGSEIGRFLMKAHAGILLAALSGDFASSAGAPYAPSVTWDAALNFARANPGKSTPLGRHQEPLLIIAEGLSFSESISPAHAQRIRVLAETHRLGQTPTGLMYENAQLASSGHFNSTQIDAILAAMSARLGIPSTDLRLTRVNVSWQGLLGAVSLELLREAIRDDPLLQAESNTLHSLLQEYAASVNSEGLGLKNGRPVWLMAGEVQNRRNGTRYDVPHDIKFAYAREDAGSVEPYWKVELNQALWYPALRDTVLRWVPSAWGISKTNARSDRLHNFVAALQHINRGQ